MGCATRPLRSRMLPLGGRPAAPRGRHERTQCQGDSARMTATRNMRLPEATISEIDGVRYLHLDTPWVQGAMDMRRPRVVVLEYVQRMLAWMLWRPQEALSH